VENRRSTLFRQRFHPASICHCRNPAALRDSILVPVISRRSARRTIKLTINYSVARWAIIYSRLIAQQRSVHFVLAFAISGVGTRDRKILITRLLTRDTFGRYYAKCTPRRVIKPGTIVKSQTHPRARARGFFFTGCPDGEIIRQCFLARPPLA